MQAPAPAPQASIPQPTAANGTVAQRPPQLITTAQIQQQLLENEATIKIIAENAAAGRMDVVVQYQHKLQANLMFLASVADAQPHPAPAEAPPAGQ